MLQVIHRRKNFHHPTLMLTTVNLVRGTFLHGGAEDDRQRVVEMARLVVAAFAAASASVLALLASTPVRHLCGALAGLLVVTNPLLYELAHYFKEDPVLSFGIVSCAWATHHHAARKDARSLVLLGVAAGIAAAGKYVGAVLVPVAALLAPARAVGSRGSRGSALAGWWEARC